MKRIKNLIIICIFIIILGGIGFFSVDLYQEHLEIQRMEKIEEIKNQLNQIIAHYQNRTVALNIDGNEHTYSMTRLDAHIYFKTSHGIYQTAEISKLASTLFDNNPNISVEEIQALIQCD